MEKFKHLLVENSGPQWIEAILFMVGGIIAGIVVSIIWGKIFTRLASKTKTFLDDIIAKHTRMPIALSFIWGGMTLGISKLSVSAETEYWETKISFALFVILISWCVMKIIDAVIAHHPPPTSETQALSNSLIVWGIEQPKFLQTDFKPVLRRLVKIIMFIIPTSVIVKSFGYDISAVLAGLGIGGAALALAARDILASFFGAIAILTDKPFRVGDRIRFVDKNFDAIDGFINEIRFRTTRITTLDNRTVVVPNTIFSSMPIQNVTSEPHTRVVQTISIRASNGYEKTKQAVELLSTLAPAGVEFGDQHLVSLSFVGLAAYKITFIFFIAKGADYFGTINAVNLEIIRVFEKADINLV